MPTRSDHRLPRGEAGGESRSGFLPWKFPYLFICARRGLEDNKKRKYRIANPSDRSLEASAPLCEGGWVNRFQVYRYSTSTGLRLNTNKEGGLTMRADPIRRALRTQPFREFSLKLVDGTVYPVHHPDWLSVPPIEHPREVLYYRVANGRAGDYDEHRIEIGLILELITPRQSEITPDRTEDNGPGS